MKKYLTGFLSIVVLLVLAIVIPEIGPTLTLRKRRLTCQKMIQLYDAERKYNQRYPGKYATIEQLVEMNFIDRQTYSEQETGYKFTGVITPQGFQIQAVPVDQKIITNDSLGAYSFYIDEKGKVHGANKKGGMATQNDPETYCKQ